MRLLLLSRAAGCVQLVRRYAGCQGTTRPMPDSCNTMPFIPLLCAGTHAELPVPQRYAVAVEDARARLA